MGKEKDSEFPVGYKNPPHHSRFKPGQSGNPLGRPKKQRPTLIESFDKELNTSVTLTEGGKRRRITKLQAIAKQQTNKAANGDYKATILVMKAIELRQSDTKDNLSPVLYAMRAIHEKHEVANRNSTRVKDASGSSADEANDQDQADKDED